jgi:hypothetical protein
MEQQPFTISWKYAAWASLALLSIAVLGLMLAYLGLIGTAVVFGLALVIFTKLKYGWLIKAWESGKLATVVRERPARNIPYYQPSRQSSYERGYQQQSSPRPAPDASPKEDHPSEFEQPQAQYPEQTPPMM